MSQTHYKNPYLKKPKSYVASLKDNFRDAKTVKVIPYEGTGFAINVISIPFHGVENKISSFPQHMPVKLLSKQTKELVSTYLKMSVFPS